jgi:ureidoglycolate lyase
MVVALREFVVELTGPKINQYPGCRIINGDSHFRASADDRLCSHIRLNIYQDGGVNRLRLFDHIVRDGSRYLSMPTLHLGAEPLRRETFSAFGDVIETEGASHFGINAGAIERFHDLAHVDVGVEEQGRTLISIARCNQPSSLPYRIRFVERHPLGSQAFIPLDDTPIVLAVAPPGEQVDPASLKAYITNGTQGFNYHRGVWHIPLILLKAGQQMVIVDRGGPGQNCDEFYFQDDEIVLRVETPYLRYSV